MIIYISKKMDLVILKSLLFFFQFGAGVVSFLLASGNYARVIIPFVQNQEKRKIIALIQIFKKNPTKFHVIKGI